MPWRQHRSYVLGRWSGTATNANLASLTLIAEFDAVGSRVEPLEQQAQVVYSLDSDVDFVVETVDSADRV